MEKAPKATVQKGALAVEEKRSPTKTATLATSKKHFKDCQAHPTELRETSRAKTTSTERQALMERKKC